ncbi:hypothetical protein BATDEDRAFT_86359 [Batrachochytrium dendrobatidis JAM81]|uniref:Pericentriolar material 1 protein C-terminal domain-containing protein n=2 Tax=Batrachochytrium dendrobatidis TaxID=109871 RepID=F4NWZ5_BATDJ|nr:uncharacterized protein BATDEDRAFT_86359 [Batrachochytrium dendrobatidis JAM81]EGF82903.1 hypothetical protein BATDEDRAFT_86359 [Batrachochytrium dendrobatidis JAM81]|eukprot:XP_006677092.1 hypothetical protein BATDEDRAFT_86359 [Batrachochytrium dendrobatidis JAM81]
MDSSNLSIPVAAENHLITSDIPIGYNNSTCLINSDNYEFGVKLNLLLQQEADLALAEQQLKALEKLKLDMMMTGPFNSTITTDEFALKSSHNDSVANVIPKPHWNPRFASLSCPIAPDILLQSNSLVSEHSSQNTNLVDPNTVEDHAKNVWSDKQLEMYSSLTALTQELELLERRQMNLMNNNVLSDSNHASTNPLSLLKNENGAVQGLMDRLAAASVHDQLGPNILTQYSSNPVSTQGVPVCEEMSPNPCQSTDTTVLSIQQTSPDSVHQLCRHDSIDSIQTPLAANNLLKSAVSLAEPVSNNLNQMTTALGVDVDETNAEIQDGMNQINSQIMILEKARAYARNPTEIAQIDGMLEKLVTQAHELHTVEKSLAQYHKLLAEQQSLQALLSATENIQLLNANDSVFLSSNVMVTDMPDSLPKLPAKKLAHSLPLLKHNMNLESSKSIKKKPLGRASTKVAALQSISPLAHATSIANIDHCNASVSTKHSASVFDSNPIKSKTHGTLFKKTVASPSAPLTQIPIADIEPESYINMSIQSINDMTDVPSSANPATDSFVFESDHINRLFAQHKDEIYRRAADTISTHDASPYFLLSVFKTLSKLDSQYARERVMIALDEIVDQVQDIKTDSSISTKPTMKSVGSQQKKTQDANIKLKPNLPIHSNSLPPHSVSINQDQPKPLKPRLSDKSQLQQLIHQALQDHITQICNQAILSASTTAKSAVFTLPILEDLMIQTHSSIYSYVSMLHIKADGTTGEDAHSHAMKSVASQRSAVESVLGKFKGLSVEKYCHELSNTVSTLLNTMFDKELNGNNKDEVASQFCTQPSSESTSNVAWKAVRNASIPSNPTPSAPSLVLLKSDSEIDAECEIDDFYDDTYASRYNHETGSHPFDDVEHDSNGDQIESRSNPSDMYTSVNTGLATTDYDCEANLNYANDDCSELESDEDYEDEYDAECQLGFDVTDNNKSNSSITLPCTISINDETEMDREDERAADLLEERVELVKQQMEIDLALDDMIRKEHVAGTFTDLQSPQKIKSARHYINVDCNNPIDPNVIIVEGGKIQSKPNAMVDSVYTGSAL